MQKDFIQRVILYFGVFLVILGILLIFENNIAEIYFNVKLQNDPKRGFVYKSEILDTSNTDKLDSQIDKSVYYEIDNNELLPIPQQNTIVIPAIGVNSVIHESNNPDVLDFGVWRKPNSSTPNNGGNTVFVAHRFMYDSSISFSLLPDLEKGDLIIIYWEGKEYNYIVESEFEVPASQVEVEQSSNNSMITLYTCTPLWNPINRYVVIAKLLEK